ncbi:unnamed protein product [Phytomonas sp. Hart1]|nr:unnamed protein product [Phytomonas sp. Hart1]|eukprot:CCW68605.1 unnamed protein product [Phytomonas sp. isolate Hart1]
MSSSESANTPSNSPVDPISELDARLSSLQDEIKYYNSLKARAQTALESHRSDLTLLQQKERAIFATKEDDLRLQLHETIQSNREALEQVEEERRKAQQLFCEELLATRSEDLTRINSLQEKQEALWRQRLKLERNLMHLESKIKKLKGVMRNDLHKQACLHTELQEAKQALLDASHKLTGTERSCSVCPKNHSETFTPLKYPTLASPRRLVSPKRHFIPSSPTISREKTVQLSRQGRRKSCDVCFDFSPLRPGHRRRDRLANIPESHNIASMVSTLERRNYLRPRAYLQQQGRDMGYQSSSMKITGGRPLPLVYAAPMTVINPCVESPRQAHGGEANAATTRVNAAGDSSAGSKSTTSLTSSSSSSNSNGAKKVAFPVPQQKSKRGSYVPRTSSRIKSQTKCSESLTPSGFPAVPITDGLALNAACQTLKDEITELEEAYTAYYKQLHDPYCDSVATSQQMRQLMLVIDRKADQLRTLRLQQQKHQEKLRIHHVLKQVERENNLCEQMYSNIVHLVRAP